MIAGRELRLNIEQRTYDSGEWALDVARQDLWARKLSDLRRAPL